MRAFAVAMLLASPALLAVRPSLLPAFTDYVVDEAHVFNAATIERLRERCSLLDHAGIAQIAVATIRDLGDTPVEEFAADLFKKWGLGHGKKRADGLLILMVPGPPGHRKTKVEVGYGLEGVLPDGKVGAIYDRVARPFIRRNDYGSAAVQLVDALASVLEENAAAGGELAPSAGSPRGGSGVGLGAQRRSGGLAGLAITIVSMGAILAALATSSLRRRFPGPKTKIAAAGLVATSVVALVTTGGGGGWIALAVGLIANAMAWASLRAHQCPKDGSWLVVEEELIEEPTYFSTGLARITEWCTNRACGFRRAYDKELPPRQRRIYVSGGGFGGGGGGGGGDGFSGGGGGDSGGAGVSRED